jgi:hypothetical protein
LAISWRGQWYSLRDVFERSRVPRLPREAQDESITGSALGSSWHDEACIEKGMLVTSNTKSMNWCETKRDYHSRAEAH